MKIRQRFKPDKLFYISDTHWKHTNIVHMCSRPFNNIEEHDEGLIQNWNSVVPKDGIVMHAGDFAWTGNIDYIKDLVSKLNGTIYHVRGNHCYQNRWDRQVIIDVFEGRSYDTLSITVEDKETPNGHVNFFISHYPHLFWERGSYHLYGHVHSGPKSTSSEKAPFHFMRYDIGVDNNNYFPISYYELMNVFKEYKENEKQSNI